MLGFSLLVLWMSPGPVTRVRLTHEAKCPQLPIPYLNSVSDTASEYCHGVMVFSLGSYSQLERSWLPNRTASYGEQRARRFWSQQEIPKRHRLVILGERTQVFSVQSYFSLNQKITCVVKERKLELLGHYWINPQILGSFMLGDGYS